MHEALIACGADHAAADRVVARHPELRDSLHWFAMEAHHHALEALVRAGTPVDTLDASGETALMAATQLGHVHIVKVLLRLGADPRACSPGSGTVLHHWTRSPEPEILRDLLAAGADPDGLDETGDSALRSLVTESASRLRLQDPDLARKLAPFLASLQIERDLPERPPEEIAEAVRLLAEAGADVDLANYGQTPLMEAAEAGDLRMVRTLLSAGADLSARDEDGRTAADLAEQAGHGDLAALLRMARPG